MEAFLLFGRVDDQSPVLFRKFLEGIRMNEPYQIHVNSLGGSYEAGIEILEEILKAEKYGKLPVTVALGSVFSSAANIYTAGVLRIAVPQAQFLFHESENKNLLTFQERQQLSRSQESLLQYVAQRLGKTVEWTRELFRHAKKIDAALARRIKLVHAVTSDIEKVASEVYSL